LYLIDIMFILCWNRLSPELHLKRPNLEGDRWRLDLVLKRKAVCVSFKQFDIFYFIFHIFVILNYKFLSIFGFILIFLYY